MDIGNVLRSLGLEALAPEAREVRDETDRSGDAADGGPDEPAELDEGGGPGEDDGGDADVVAGGDAIEDLRHELDQVAADLETTQSKLRAVQSERDEMVARLDGLEEDTAQLLGVYDRLTAEVNPFSEQWRQSAETAHADAESRYGVVVPTERDPVTEATDAETNGHELDDAYALDADESPVEETPSVPAEVTEAHPEAAITSASGAYLRGLAPSFATEVLLMEWMTMLIDSAGPGGAMKAVDYYERINWIDASVKDHLEDLLGGVQTAPLAAGGAVDDLTSEEHSQSFAYIMKLDGLRATVTSA